MKIALITDLHIGGKQDSILFHNHIEKFYMEQFFPYLEEHGINQIIMLGDIFDRRKYINYVSLRESRRYLFSKLQEYNVDVIIGNHDCFFKSTNYPNAPELLLQEYTNVNIISSPTVHKYGDREIVLMPWINQENEAEAFELIKNSSARTLFGHLEVNGFAMYKGYESTGGISADLFEDYNLVCSGHFHHKSVKGNIHYLGAPYEITWSDWEDPRGFHIYDTEDNSLTFVQNFSNLFIKIKYDDTKYDYTNFDTSILGDKYVKIFVEEKNDLKVFDSFMSKVNKENIIELDVIEDLAEFSVRYQDIDDSINVEDTPKLMDGYIRQMDVSERDRNRVSAELKSLYLEALEIE